MAKTKEIINKHSVRILSYGKYRAFALLTMAKRDHCWPHVDWKYIEDNLKGVTWENAKSVKSDKKGKKCSIKGK